MKSEDPLPSNWVLNEAQSLCDLYIKMTWCEKYVKPVPQYEAFVQAIHKVKNQKEFIVKRFIEKTPGMRRFLQIHSVFKIDDNINGDWLAKLMIKETMPTEEDVNEVHELDVIPQHILDSLAIFDPRPLGFEKHLMDIRIEYKMWGDRKKKEFGEPINIIDRVWERLGLEYQARVDAAAFINSHDVIDIGTPVHPSEFPSVLIESEFEV